jgi:hypothetical protein
MKNYLFTASAALFLFGCTTTPPRPNAAVNAQQITYAILSEFYCAATEKPVPPPSQLAYSDTVAVPLPTKAPPVTLPATIFNPNDQWILALELNLSASIEGSVAPSISLLGPLNAFRAVPTGGTTGTFTTALAGSFDQTRTNARDYKIYIDVNQLLGQGSGDPAHNWLHSGHSTTADCLNPNGDSTYLAGHLGIDEWLAPAFYAQLITRGFAPAPTKTADNGSGDTFTSLLLGRRVVKRQGGTPNRIVHVADASTVQLADLEGTLDKLGPEDRQAVITALMSAGQTGSQSSPTIGVTFTFTIKASGTMGPSFVLTRASGGSSGFFSGTRTDTNYVNLVLTPTTYCPTLGWVIPVGKTNCQAPTADLRMMRASTAPDMDAAIGRAENTLFTLNLNRALTP